MARRKRSMMTRALRGAQGMLDTYVLPGAKTAEDKIDELIASLGDMRRELARQRRRLGVARKRRRKAVRKTARKTARKTKRKTMRRSTSRRRMKKTARSRTRARAGVASAPRRKRGVRRKRR